MTRSVYLIGLPSAGTSQVAVALAKRLRARLLDTELLLARRFNVSVDTAVVTVGEEKYRRAEETVCRELCTRPAVLFREAEELGLEVSFEVGDEGGVNTPTERFGCLEHSSGASAASTDSKAQWQVFALGSGFLDSDEARQKLAQAADIKLFFLDLDLNEVALRSGFNRPRSVGLGMPRLWLKQFNAARQQKWRELAGIWIDTTGKTLEEITAEIADGLG